MKYKKMVPVFLPVLLMAIVLLPVQVALCQSTATVEKIEASTTKTIVKPVKTDSVDQPAEQVLVKKESSKKRVVSSPETETTESSLSTGAIIGISTGAVVLVGGAIALLSGGGSSDPPPPPPTPPTADQIVGAWNANASQAGSGLTYTGTYQLYQGGGVAYNIYISDGRHFVGGGSWKNVEYKLYVHTDHGSLYIGDFAPGNINSVTLNASNGWTLTLSR